MLPVYSMEDPVMVNDIFNGNVYSDLATYNRSMSTVFDSGTSITENEDEELNVENNFGKPVSTAQPQMLRLTAKEIYERECFKYLSPPISSIMSALTGHTEIVDLENYDPDPINLFVSEKGINSENKSAITNLKYANNIMREETIHSISHLLEQNQLLSHLDLSRCSMNTSCVELLVECIEVCDCLKCLNVFNCQLGDTEGALLLHSLINNESILEINFGHNDLHILAANELKSVLEHNTYLKILNFTWNLFYPCKEASLKIAKGLLKNKRLEELDLSWNGISGNLFANAIRSALRRHPVITAINLENNCLMGEDLEAILNGMRGSNSLQTIKLGGNVWDEQLMKQAIAFAHSHATLQIFSFGEYQMVPDLVATYAEETMLHKPALIIVFLKKVAAKQHPAVDFRAIVIDRCKFLAMKPKKKKYKRNMGHFMYQLKDHEMEKITMLQFFELITDFKAKLDEELVTHLAEVFTQKVQVGKRKGKRVFIKEMADYYLRRHQTYPPTPLSANARKGKSKKK